MFSLLIKRVSYAVKLQSLQEKLYGKSITLADREMVEEKADDILLEARSSDVAFLVVGDPFGYLSFLSDFSLNSSFLF